MTKAKTVRRQDFADALSAATPGLDPRNARRLVDAVVAQLITELRAAGDVIVPGLGRFTAKRKPARRFFNPGTGEVGLTPPRSVVTCKVAQHLMSRVFDGDE